MAVRLSGAQGSWTLPEGETLIGRGDGCGVRVNDPRLSRQHAKLVVSGRQVAIQDLGSANGILVNGDRIMAPAILFPGDDIVCGPLNLVVETDTASTPSAVRPDPVTETLRGLVGDHVPDHPYRSTESMDPGDLRLASDSAAARPPSRLNPAIAAAVSGTVSHKGSTSIRPSEMLPAINTSALSPHHPPAQVEPPTPRRTTSILPTEAPVADTNALVQDPGWAKRPPRRARLAAGVVDPLVAILGSLLCGGVVAGAGTALALLAAQVGFTDGRLVLPAAAPAAFPELVRGMLQPSAWAGLGDLVQAMRAQPSSGPFVGLFASWALGAVLAEALLLWFLVAATVGAGAPWYHRRVGLVLVVRRNGHHLGWLRALARWGVLGLTVPLALLTALLGWRGLHDLVSGSEVRRRG